MNGALNAWRGSVVEQLQKSGLNAIAAMESVRASRWRETVAAVSLSRVVCAPGGFTDYLGVRKDPAGRVEFLEKDGLYRQEISCRCKAWLVARVDDEAGVFTDFEVRGRLK